VMYHGLGGTDGVAVEAFERQLATLAQRRKVVPLAQAVGTLGQPESHGLAAITFDDGYRDFREFAVPVLQAMGLHATVFVPAGWVGRKSTWDAGYQRCVMSARELRELDPDIVTVGAHGVTHTRLAALPAERLRSEVHDARNLLEDVCGHPVLLYAYPYGQREDFDVTAERAVEEGGFIAACSTRYGRGSEPDERFRLRRVGIEPGDSLARVEQKLDGAYDWIAAKEVLGASGRRIIRWSKR
jgi:peptidoglycan/xylan/chitin deacetylase (PgdA/CDA1 family)